MTDQQPTRSSDLERFIRILRRRRLLITLSVLALTTSALLFSLLQQKQYSATSALLFRDPAIDKSLFQSAYAPYVDPNREAATNEKLASLSTVAARTAEQFPGLTAGRIESEVSVANEGQSDVVSVSATDHSPTLAAQLANAFAANFIAIRREADQAVIRNAQRLVSRRLKDVNAADRRTLQSRADDLKILASLQTGKAEVVQPASVPGSPSSPKPLRNSVIGGILGLILGVAFAFLIDRLDRRLKDPRELEETYRLPVLGAIPESKALRRASKGKDSALIPGPEWEAFRKLRAKLQYFNVDKNMRTVLITSSAPEEGKTTVASNLAIAAAMSGNARVLLLEADLRKPSLTRSLELAPIPGLAELITHDIVISEATQRLRVPSWNGTDASLDVIVAGAEPPNPAELLESMRMVELLDRLGAMYDLIIIDTPPVSIVADAMPLMRHVDGVIAVCWIGASTRDGAMHLRHELDSLGAPSLGIVVNRVRTGAEGYYGYGYAAEPIDLKALERA